MQSDFVIIAKLIASKNYICREFFCNNFGRDGTVEKTTRAVRAKWLLRLLSRQFLCEYFFSYFAWEFCIEKRREFLVNFFWSPFPTKPSTKTPQTFRGKFGAKIRGKIRDKNSKNSGNFRCATFLTQSCERERPSNGTASTVLWVHRGFLDVLSNKYFQATRTTMGNENVPNYPPKMKSIHINSKMTRTSNCCFAIVANYWFWGWHLQFWSCSSSSALKLSNAGIYSIFNALKGQMLGLSIEFCELRTS